MKLMGRFCDSSASIQVDQEPNNLDDRKERNVISKLLVQRNKSNGKLLKRVPKMSVVQTPKFSRLGQNFATHTKI